MVARFGVESGVMQVGSSTPPQDKRSNNDPTRRTIERKEVYPRTEIPRQGTDVGLRTARERSVGDIFYHHGRSVLGSVL